MAEDNFEKTEAPTPRRRTEAREEGNVARSTDLSAAVMLLASVLLLHVLGMRVLGGMKWSVEASLTHAHAGNPTRPDDLVELASFSAYILASSLTPLLLAVMAVGVVGIVGQVGLVLTGKPLVPKLSKLDPIKGVKNLVNLKAAMRLVMSLGKIILIVAVTAWVVMRDMPWLIHIGELGVGQAFAASAELVYHLALKLAVLLLVLAILDFAYQKWQHEQELKMSKQEVKEEMKRMDGDPMVKQRRARVARQLAMQRIAQAVPKADVVVTNPTHFAVALRYDAKTMRAPTMVAKGADYMAVRVRQIAAAHGVPIVERKPLARALYAGVDVGQEVPAEHYAAVAEILAYVYRLAKRSA